MKKFTLLFSLSIIIFTSLSSCSKDDNEEGLSPQKTNKNYLTNNTWEVNGLSAILVSDGLPIGLTFEGTLKFNINGTYEATSYVKEYFEENGTWEFNESSVTEIILNAGTSSELSLTIKLITENDMELNFTDYVPNLGEMAHLYTDWDPIP